MSQIAARYGISRKTGSKWVERYKEAGVAGLTGRSLARYTRARRIDAETARTLLALRQERPTWGPKQLLARLRQAPRGVDCHRPGAGAVSAWFVQAEGAPSPEPLRAFGGIRCLCRCSFATATSIPRHRRLPVSAKRRALVSFRDRIMARHAMSRMACEARSSGIPGRLQTAGPGGTGE